MGSIILTIRRWLRILLCAAAAISGNLARWQSTFSTLVHLVYLVHLLHLGPRGFVFYRSRCWGRLDQQGKMPTKVFKATSQEERDSLDRRSSGSWRRSSQCTWFPHISISTHWLSHISINTQDSLVGEEGVDTCCNLNRRAPPHKCRSGRLDLRKHVPDPGHTFVTSSAPVTYSL